MSYFCLFFAVNRVVQKCTVVFRICNIIYMLHKKAGLHNQGGQKPVSVFTATVHICPLTNVDFYNIVGEIFIETKSTCLYYNGCLPGECWLAGSSSVFLPLFVSDEIRLLLFHQMLLYSEL